MNRIIGMAWCRLFGKHKCTRAKYDLVNDIYAKRCTRCGATRVVKQRKPR